MFVFGQKGNERAFSRLMLLFSICNQLLSGELGQGFNDCVQYYSSVPSFAGFAMVIAADVIKAPTRPWLTLLELTFSIKAFSAQ